MPFIDAWTICVAILINLPLPTTGSTQLYVTNTKNITWTDANNTCTLAQPDIVYLSDRERLDFNTSLITKDIDPWVGIYAAITTFRYVGCWHRSHLEDYTIKDIITRADVGICYTACRSRFFGIVRSGHCKCLDGLETTQAANWSRCYKACSGIACGSSNSHMSVYEAAQTPLPSPNSAMCLTLRNTLKSEWRNCFDENVDGIICTYDNAFEIRKLEGHWFDQVKTCTGHGNLTKDEMHTKVRTPEHNQVYWTTTVGVPTIYKASGDAPARVKPLKFGYAQRDGDFFRLSFRDDASGSSAICQMTATTTATLTRETSTETPSTTTSNEPFTHKTVDRQEETRSCGLYIGLSIGMTLLVAGVVVAVVFVLLRMKYRKTPTERNDRNVAYNTGIRTTGMSSPEYAISDSTTSSKQRSTVVPNASATTENVYDVSGRPAQDRHRQTSDDCINVYNIASKSEPEEDVYDHTTDGLNFPARMTAMTTSPSDNVYDVSGSRTNYPNLELDNVYNTANEVEFAADIYNNTNKRQPSREDAYDLVAYKK